MVVLELNFADTLFTFKVQALSILILSLQAEDVKIGSVPSVVYRRFGFALSIIA